MSLKGGGLLEERPATAGIQSPLLRYHIWREILNIHHEMEWQMLRVIDLIFGGRVDMVILRSHFDRSYIFIYIHRGKGLSVINN